MALVDPTGLVGGVVGYGVNVLLDRLLTEAKNVIHCRDNCRALGELLRKIQPMVVDVQNRLPGGGSGSRGVKAWLADLQKVLVEADRIASKCNKAKSYNIIELKKMSSKILDITSQIVDICTTHASIASMNIGAHIHHDLVLVKTVTLQKLDEIKKILQAQDQALGRIESSSNRIERKLEHVDARAVAPEKLYTRRQVPKKTFGMAEPVKKLQDLLLDDKKKWIGVCGRGGMGKTLLATQVCNSKTVQDHFGKKIYWITVGENKSTQNKRSIELRLLQRLGEKLNVEITENMEPDEVKDKLWDALSGRKVLLVFDDVWNDGFNVLGSLDVTSDDTGSKILVTTRDKQVLRKKKKSDISVLRMQGLTPNDSWELFRDSTFTDVVQTNQLEKLGKLIAGECRGLPLALKVIAGTLAGQESPQEWQRILNGLKEAEIVSKEQEIQLYGRLQLSYDLETHPHRHRLQKCFIYFAAYREDSDVYSEKLVNLWIGEKLANDRADGYYLLNELIGRSLIDLRKETWSDNYNYLQLTCRVHDVLRDFARYLISQKSAPMNCLFRAGEGLKEFPDEWLTPIYPSDATHLSLNNNPLQSLPNELKAPRLEILLLANKEYPWEGLIIPPKFFESFSSLKVLDLKNTLLDSLPESLEKCTNLRYLELSGTLLRKLPLGLQNLTKLEHIGLAGCEEIEPWPFDISDLRRLSTLDTFKCRVIWENKVPSSILEDDDDQRGTNPWESTQDDPLEQHRKEMEIMKTTLPCLNSLESLCSLTSLQNLSIESTRNEHLPSEISKLVNLRHLRISFKRLKTLPSELLSSNGPQLSMLQVFCLGYCKSLSELPSWVVSLSHLANLNLIGCQMLKSLPNLHKLPELRKLDLSCCLSLQHLPCGFASSGAFPALELLIMRRCASLTKFPPIGKGAFPSLREINLSFCESLTEFPLIGKGAFPKLVILRMEDCSNLEKLPAGFTSSGAFPSLKELYLADCEKLREFPPIEEGAFAQLNILGLNRSGFEKIPSSFCLLSELVRLDLEGCGKIKDLDDCFCLHGKDSNCQTSQLQQTLPYFEKLEELDLWNVPLDHLPNGLAACPTLRKIHLGRTTFKLESIPKQLQTLLAKGKLTILFDEEEDPSSDEEDA